MTWGRRSLDGPFTFVYNNLMTPCKRCKKPTAEFPTNKYGRPSTMCQRCYSDTMWRNAKKFALYKEARSSPPDGMSFCMRCRKPKPLDDFKVDPQRKRQIGRGETLSKQCAACRSDNAKFAAKRRAAMTDEAKKQHSIERGIYARGFRLKILEKYGNVCICCGETEIKFLQVDHVNNDGHDHRKEIGVTAEALYRWAEAKGFPPTLQVLCANCHAAKSFHGTCPHEEIDVLKLVERHAKAIVVLFNRWPTQTPLKEIHR